MTPTLDGLADQFRGTTFREVANQLMGYFGPGTTVLEWDLTYDRREHLRVRFELDYDFARRRIRGPAEMKALVKSLQSYSDSDCEAYQIDIAQDQHVGGPPSTFTVYFRSKKWVDVEKVEFRMHPKPLEYYDAVTEPYYETTYGQVSSKIALEEAGFIDRQLVAKKKPISWRRGKLGIDIEYVGQNCPMF